MKDVREQLEEALRAYYMDRYGDDFMVENWAMVIRGQNFMNPDGFRHYLYVAERTQSPDELEGLANRLQRWAID